MLLDKDSVTELQGFSLIQRDSPFDERELSVSLFLYVFCDGCACVLIPCGFYSF